MISVEIILYILFVHFIGDFIMQSRKMAENKSKSVKWLSIHVLVYSLTTMFGWTILGINPLFVFILTFIPHWIIDFTTSKGTRYLFYKKEWHWFFALIGFDQILHYICLFYMYKLLL